MKYPILLLLALFFAPAAWAISVTQTVDGHDNLFYTAWGHWFDAPSDRAIANPNSNLARSVQNNDAPLDFAGFDDLSVTASGKIVDHFSTATGPNGDTCAPSCLFNDGQFRDVRAYGLIGLWSSTAASITPIDDPHTAPFFYRQQHRSGGSR